MPDTPNLGESAYAILTAAALLIRRAKYGSDEWTAANGALAALTRLQDEIRSLNEQLERRASVVAVDPLAVANVVPPDQSRARTPARTPARAPQPVTSSLPSEDRVGGLP